MQFNSSWQSTEKLRRLNDSINLLNGYRFVANSLHVRTKLSGYFSEHLFCKVAHCHSLIEGNKLDDVSRTGSLCVISKQGAIPIELVHTAEVCVANTDDDDWAGQSWEIYDRGFCLGHVANLTVGQEQQNLVVCLTAELPNVSFKLSQKRRKQSRTTQFNLR